jgi:hypothetical protein
MNSVEWAWLVSTGLEVVGLAMALGVLGFTYEGGLRERKPFAAALEEGHRAGWLAAGVMIFAVGLCFTKVGWGYKVIALALGALMAVMARPSYGREKSVTDATVKRSAAQRKSRLWYAWIIGGVILLFVVGWAAHLGWHTIRLVETVRGTQNDPSQIKMESIVPLVDQSAGDIEAIHRDLRPFFPILSVLKGLPGIGPSLSQVEPMVTYADSIAQAGKELSLGLVPLLEDTQADQADPTLLEQVSQLVEAGQDHFIRAKAEIEKADAVRSQIQPELLPDSIRTLYLKLEENFKLLSTGAQLLPDVPTLLGNGQAQNYLILAQNRDELRATGGFISGIGLLTIQDGKIQQFTLGDSYAVDDFSKSYPSPPEALKRFMLADYWVPRDANWSPDFPTSAQEAQTLYTLSTGIETQGVIAFNQLMVERVLELIGPVEVPGTSEPVTSDNVDGYMRQAWAPAPDEGISQEWWAHRKDFMQQLGNVILEKILKIKDQNQILKLAEVMGDLLDQGQLLVYFNDFAAQSALQAASWTGAVRPGDGDYLYLVDSNFGFNKMDSVIQRSLTYRVDLTDIQHPTGEATITYQNSMTGNVACEQVASYGNGTYQDMQRRCYWDYWRVYTPKGSQPQSSTAQPVPADQLLNGEGWSGQVESLAGEANTQVFAGMLVLPLAAATQVDIAYQLPISVLENTGTGWAEYSLQVQVQPGLEGLPFRLEISLPDSAHITSSSDGLSASSVGRWVWEGVIHQSTEFNITFSQQQ